MQSRSLAGPLYGAMQPRSQACSSRAPLLRANSSGGPCCPARQLLRHLNNRFVLHPCSRGRLATVAISGDKVASTTRLIGPTCVHFGAIGVDGVRALAITHFGSGRVHIPVECR